MGEQKKSKSKDIAFEYEIVEQESTALEAVFNWLFEQVEKNNQSQND